MDPIIEVTSGPQTVDQILADADSAQADFLAQASEAIESRGAPVKPAAPPAKPSAPSEPAKPALAPAPEKGKVPGPPVTAPAPKVEPAKIEDDLPQEYTPGKMQKSHWEKLKGLRDAAEAKAATLEKQLAELARKTTQTGQPQPELQARLEELQKSNDDLLGRLESVAVERSPRFEAAFKPRIEAAISLAKSVVPQEHAEEVAQLLQAPESAYRTNRLKEIAQSMDQLSVGALSNAYGEMNRINAEKNLATQKSRELFKQWSTEEQQRSENQRKTQTEEAQKTLHSEISEWQKSVGILQPKEGDDAHNRAVNSRVEMARSIFLGGLPMQDLARASIWASIGPDLAAQVSERDQRIASLESELSALRGAQPNTASDAGSSVDDAGEPDPNLSYADAIARSVAGAGLLR